ncbi:capsular polysaccharide synthesis protein [Demequina subtropica]|uniref:capsular polysaccharide synthesis protein n=1 Tax=Demequina subtropica TaxID=1638989 RepID=UPI00078259B3|nr:capsular polysaccharide synthesis protein [Demequina subtropica]
MDKTIWILWLQGWDDAPRLVQSCVESWRRANPTWTVRTIDRSDVATLVPDLAIDPGVKPAAQSDRIRLALLDRFGGAWADATTFCMEPLDSWLPDPLPTGFFAFRAPRPGRALSSWFLAAESGSPIIAGWHAASERYWSERSRASGYFWLHELFGELIATDPIARRAWEEAPRISARGPHFFGPYRDRFYGPMPRDGAAHVASRRTPVYKLTNAALPDEPDPTSAYSLFASGHVPAPVSSHRFGPMARFREHRRQNTIDAEWRRREREAAARAARPRPTAGES